VIRGIAWATGPAYISARTRNQSAEILVGNTSRLLACGSSRREPAMAQISLTVNGKPRVVDTDPSTPLLYVLRDDLGLNGPKFGCGLSQCGACTVILDGNTARSCSIPASAARNRKVTTLEGLGSVANPHRLQKAFIEEQAAQCGYCMNGIVMTAKVLLDRNPHPSELQIKQALQNNLCRCGSHLRVIRAIQRAAREKA
jgi:nicotinate dehydrogenase subunit A